MSKVTILSKPNRIVIASKGVQGPPGPEGPEGIQGEKGDTGDVTPEALAARDAAVDAADAASQSADAAAASSSVAVGSATTASAKSDEAAASADLAEQARLLGATIGFATKADMDASLAHPDGTLALVTNDPDPANSVTYRKTGASGSGSWVQSADRVSGLEGRVGAVETSAATAKAGADALLGVAQTMGYAGALAVSTNGSAGTYAMATPLAQNGRGIRYRYRSNVVGTLWLQILDRSGDTFTVAKERQIAVSATGEQAAEVLDLTYTAGQYLGVRVSATGVLAVVAGVDPDGGWYYTNAQVPQGGSFVDASATTTTRINHGVELMQQSVTADRFEPVEQATAALSASVPPLEVSAAMLTGPQQVIGYEGALPAGAPNGSGGTYSFMKPIASSGRGIRYRYLANVAGTVRVQLQSKAGDTVTVLEERPVVIAGPGEGVAEFPGWEYTAGQFMGVRISAAGVLAAQGAVDPDGGWLYTNAQIAAGGSFVDAEASTTVRVAHSIELREQVVTGPRFLALEAAVDEADPPGDAVAFHVHLVLGESHAAGATTTLSAIEVPVGRGYSYRKATESLAQLKDPTGNTATSAGPPGRGSMFPAFGAQVLKQTGNKVGAIIVNCGVGGTTAGTHWGASGSSWLAAVDDWGNALAAIRAAGLIVSGVSVSIILGSNDAAAGTTPADFKTQMLSLIARARTLVDAGARVPVVLMETGPYNDGTYASQVAAIQQVQAEIVRDEPDVFLGYSARYAVARGQMIDAVHMNQQFNDDCGAALAAAAGPHGVGHRPFGLL